MSDIINKSPHYNAGSIECIDALKEWLTEEQYRGFLKGNVIKYLCREGHKDSREQDCEKAKYYLDKLVQTFGEENLSGDIVCDGCVYFCAEYDDWCEKNCKHGVPANSPEYDILPSAYKERK